jgi:hypothetical protein
MEQTQVDKTDHESADLQHFWKILLRGMEVKIPFENKEDDSVKRGGEGKKQEQFSVFWLDGTTLYLRKSKQCFSDQRGISSMMQEKVGAKIPLKELRDVGFGGVDGSGVEDDEDEDELNASPCLNKVSKTPNGLCIAFQTTQLSMLKCCSM